MKPSHALLPLARAGVALQRRHPLSVGLLIQWALLQEPRR
jgi:hypothetical protein